MKLFERLSGLRLQDGPILVALFCYSLVSAAAYLFSRTAADSIFLSRVGPEQLPALHLLSAGVVGVIALGYGRLVAWMRLIPAIRYTLVTFAVCSIALGIAADRTNPPYLAVLLYLLTQIRGALGTMQFISLVAEESRHERPERIYGIVGAGATLAGVISAATIAGMTFGLHLDIENFLFLAAALDGMALLLLKRLIDQEPEGEQSAATEEQPPDDDARPGTRRFVWLLAAMLALMIAALTSVEITWKITAAETMLRDEEALAEYFGAFYGALYLLTGAAQLFMSGRAMAWLGPRKSLLILPAMLAVALGTVAGAAQYLSLLGTMTFAKGCDALRRSLHDPAMQAIYTSLGAGVRNPTLVLTTGIVKPVVEAVTAGALVFLIKWLSPGELVVPMLLLALSWLLVTGYLVRKLPSLGSGDELTEH